MGMKTYVFTTTMEGEFSVMAGSITDAYDRVEKIKKEHKTLTLTNIKKMETSFDREEP